MEEKKEGKVTIRLPKLNIWIVISLILAITLVLSLLQGWSITGKVVGIQLSAEEAGKKAVEYINNNLVEPGTSASMLSIEDLGSVYKVITSYQGRQIPIYITKDGKYLFLSAYDTSEEIEREQPPQQQPQEVDWSFFQTSLPSELKSKILTFTYQEPVQVEDRVQEFKDYSECKGNVIVFYLEWCGWCKKYYPILVEAKEDYHSVVFYTLDLEKNKDIGDKFGVRGVPATIINCRYLIGGYLPKESLYPILNKYME